MANRHINGDKHSEGYSSRYRRLTRLFCLPFLLGSILAGVTGIAEAQLVAAVLPSSRSAEVGKAVTVFATIINAGSDAATGCGIEGPAGLGIDFRYQATDPTTNQPTGVANTPVDLAAGASQSFVLSLTPATIISAIDAEFSFSCASGSTATPIGGINTLLLSAADTPVPDIVALAATTENTGVLDINNAAGAFALATVNLGAADTVTVAADTGGVALPITLSVCQTNPSTGMCFADPAPELTLSVAAGATPTFSVFSAASGRIVNDPALNRVFVRFRDSNSVIRGGTSVAIDNELDLAPSLSVSTLSVLNRVFALLFGGGFSPTSEAGVEGITPLAAQSIDQTILCEMGQIVVTGDLDAGAEGSTSTLTMNFEECDGIDGSVTNVTQVAFDTNSISLISTQNGFYSSEECEEVLVTNLRLATAFEFSEAPVEDLVETLEFDLSGTISGRCEGQDFNCNLQDVDLRDEAEFTNSCSI